MKILVTGANGFIGKNLIAEMQNAIEGKTQRYPFLQQAEIFACDIETTQAELENFCKECDFVMHLAGINRPQSPEEFMLGNFGFTTTLLTTLERQGNASPVLMSSSIQAELDNEYGKSKKAGEDYLKEFGQKHAVSTYIFRLPNVFGKWCRPNYNSAVATFCHNITHDLPITVSNRDNVLNLVYVDDVIDAFIRAIEGNVEKRDGICFVPTTYTTTLGWVVDKLYEFRNNRDNLSLPNMQDGLEKKLYSTYLSYLPRDGFSYSLQSHVDARGSFTEFLHTANNGQVSVNVSKPHVVKGNHWHHTKNEKFLVVKGSGIIRFRRIDETEVIEYRVCGEKLEVVDIPCGYTHNIENIGDTDMVTIMWANECFDKNAPDTYYLEV